MTSTPNPDTVLNNLPLDFVRWSSTVSFTQYFFSSNLLPHSTKLLQHLIGFLAKVIKSPKYLQKTEAKFLKE